MKKLESLLSPRKSNFGGDSIESGIYHFLRIEENPENSSGYNDVSIVVSKNGVESKMDLNILKATTRFDVNGVPFTDIPLKNANPAKIQSLLDWINQFAEGGDFSSPSANPTPFNSEVNITKKQKVSCLSAKTKKLYSFTPIAVVIN